MSEREQFNAWLKTWALPGNTSREDAMYAAWQARADRTATAEPVAQWQYFSKGIWSRWMNMDENDLEQARKEGFEVRALYSAPDALRAEVERLRLGMETLTESLDDSRKTGMTILKELNESKAENERLREERDSYQRVGIKAIEEHDALKAIIEGLFRCDEGENGEQQYHVGWNDCVEYIQAQAEVARTAKPEVKS